MGNTSHDRSRFEAWTKKTRFFEELMYNLFLVLNADESSLIAMQLDMNPIVDSRQSIDLFPR